MVGHSFNASTWEAEAGGLRIQGHLRPYLKKKKKFNFGYFSSHPTCQRKIHASNSLFAAWSGQEVISRSHTRCGSRESGGSYLGGP
jgi:hypothetical protein